MSSECIFCEILRGNLPVTTVYEDEFSLAFMDLYPMRPGHVLVIPKEHHVSILQLSPKMRSHLFELGAAVALAQAESGLKCKAQNFFINDGPDANQHVPHVHLHVLPRSGADLHKALFSFVSRYNNFFGVAAKRRRLALIAKDIKTHMPRQITSVLTSADRA
ncbi:HIT family protein [Gammaproteobacteria bacterium 42_54_T18]|nr:HIT family protein [Gammaproteobacteria bacterium 42_54_T18]